MIVTHFERLRFHVQSSADSTPYLVDMGCNHGVGECGCPHFQYRLRPGVVAEHPELASQCKHIIAVLCFIGRIAVEQLRKQNPDETQPS